MMLGAIYTVFNGTELLKGSIQQIRNDVDIIVIVYQKISNKGHKCDSELEAYLGALRVWDCKIHLVQYNPDLMLNTKANERRKHNVGLKYLKEFNCTHFVLLACDHYFKTEEFKIGKLICEKYDYDVSLTEMFTYYKHPQWRLTPIEDYFMPFICKIYKNTEFVPAKYHTFLTDPSVRINTSNSIATLDEDRIMLHHFSMIRIDIENKFKNSCSSVRWTDEMIKTYSDEYKNYDIKENKGLAYFGGRKIEIVTDYFNIGINSLSALSAEETNK